MKVKHVRMLAVASLMLSVTFLAGGCAKKAVPTEEAPVAPVETPRVDVGDRAGADESLDSNPYTASNAKISEGRTHGPMLPVYFDFDKSDIRDDQQSRIEGNGDFLRAYPTVQISIEGNCDERGTNEYNMALGERRAQQAKKYLANLGVDEARLNTVSYGEEKPLLYGHDEYSWAQNRRDDFVIR
ncbi:MAG: peptidoglycan-associated lipoprotein [Desulfobulbaceae bacterium DB1]|nr:MAG: peptidoglycan-associated lipoprotein [Desulfobulbaceae bacterium DB1]